ncbi:MAG: hypothetical protein AAFR88_13150 [Pseudomonadota bacterium]
MTEDEITQQADRMANEVWAQALSVAEAILPGVANTVARERAVIELSKVLLPIKAETFALSVRLDNLIEALNNG